jgi:hypothetical protein
VLGVVWIAPNLFGAVNAQRRPHETEITPVSNGWA